MTEVDPSGAEPPRTALRYVQIGIAALALVVPLYMLALIFRSSVFTRFDYFEMVPTVLDADGSVIWSGLLVHQNEHLMAIPKLAYLANIWAFAGSNITLGVFVWLVAGGVAAVLTVALRNHSPIDGWTLPLVAWLFAVYLFPLQAQHNFRLAMSGTAWILANLFAVAAIAFAVHRRSVSAAAAGGLATLTYGTGLAIWPALGLIMLVRRRFGRGEAVVVGVALVSVTLQRVTAESDRSAYYDWSPISIGRSMAITVGGLFVAQTDVAMLIGLGLIALGIASIISLGRELNHVAPLIVVATMTYTLVGLALFGVTRSAFGDDAFTVSRYMAFAALFVLAVSLLGLMAFRRSTGFAVAIAAVAAASVLASNSEIARFDAMVEQTDLGMLAVSMDAGVGVVPLYTEATDAAFRAVGHIPFHAGVPFGCGRYGDQLDAASVSEPGRVDGAVTGRREPATASAFLRPSEVEEIPVFEVSGWVVASGVECIVIVDPKQRVTGIALLGRPTPSGAPDDGRPGGARSWKGYLDRESPNGQVLVKLRGDDHFHVIGQLPEG